nr:immunoglobulin light chain junction region [Macaca mulatta]MOV80255.1 immunoglobulin light chain junction region [Macaca mulatta]MOV80593.1 immunoglobulin light chain junction region [Macaca mulatta]MOV83930.1 immunoglobulin light chain junction region [Macaca mulatta]MOX08002.1 immunoglobulin light chain junction region [Macaca mulatta]
CMQAVEFPLTF